MSPNSPFGFVLFWLGLLVAAISICVALAAAGEYVAVVDSTYYYREFKGLSEMEIEWKEGYAAVTVRDWLQFVWEGLMLAAAGAVLECLAKRNRDQAPPPPPPLR